MAGENFHRSAEEKKGQAAEKLRESAADQELSGDSFSNALDYRAALREYQNALMKLKVYHKNLVALGVKFYPEYTADVQRLSGKLSNAKVGMGERVAGPDSRRYLE